MAQVDNKRLLTCNIRVITLSQFPVHVAFECQTSAHQYFAFHRLLFNGTQAFNRLVTQIQRIFVAGAVIITLRKMSASKSAAGKTVEIKTSVVDAGMSKTKTSLNVAENSLGTKKLGSPVRFLRKFRNQTVVGSASLLPCNIITADRKCRRSYCKVEKNPSRKPSAIGSKQNVLAIGVESAVMSFQDSCTFTWGNNCVAACNCSPNSPR